MMVMLTLLGHISPDGDLCVRNFLGRVPGNNTCKGVRQAGLGRGRSYNKMYSKSQFC